MTSEISIDNLFEDHSIEDIELIRDSLSNEIEKRTEQLKTIVKGKYRDIVETSDAILSMQDKLRQIETSIRLMDKSTGEFFDKLRQDPCPASPKKFINNDSKSYSNDVSNITLDEERQQTNKLINDLIHHSSQVQVNCYEKNLNRIVDSLNICFDIIDENEATLGRSEYHQIISGIKMRLDRSRQMIKKSIWYSILKAGPESVGLIANKTQTSIFKLSLDAALEFLKTDLCIDISDMSSQAQLERYQPQVAFNTTTNEIDYDLMETEVNLSTHVLIPQLISPELSHYLFSVCKAINTISGSNKDYTSTMYSLRATICVILQVYEEILPIADALKGDNKRRRCLQLYFDLLYVRTILNSSKSIELMETLDFQITDLTQRYERLVDPVELFMISKGIQKNVINLREKTIRLYGLLIPHLQ